MVAVTSKTFDNKTICLYEQPWSSTIRYLDGAEKSPRLEHTLCDDKETKLLDTSH